MSRWGDEGMRGSRERGNILVMFALLLPVFMVTAAIAVDVGYWWVTGKKAQIAADACALAAAQELPEPYPDVNNCLVAPGQGDYVLVNLPDQSGPDPDPDHVFTRLRSPYGGDDDLVEATVHMRVRTFFGRYVGLGFVDIERRAVAQKKELNSRMAIFVAEQGGGGAPACSKGFLVGGKRVHVEGYIHSNGQYKINSANVPDHFWAENATYAPENCGNQLDPSPNGARYGGTLAAPGPSSQPATSPKQDWPEWFTPGQFGWDLPVDPTPGTPAPGTCTYKSDEIDVTATQLIVKGVTTITLATNSATGNKIIPTGTYCATKHFKVTGDNHEGEITALAPLITVDGNGQDYRGYAFGMLFFTVPNIDATSDAQYDARLVAAGANPPNPPCNPSTALEMGLNGNNYQWAGIIFSPCGKVKVNNQASLVGKPGLTGTIYAREVEINGDGFGMRGTGSGGGDYILGLFE